MLVKNKTYALFIIGFMLTFYGFKLVAQSISSAPLIQDDGYTVTGGFMLFGSGLVFGHLLTERMNSKGKRNDDK